MSAKKKGWVIFASITFNGQNYRYPLYTWAGTWDTGPRPEVIVHRTREEAEAKLTVLQDFTGAGRYTLEEVA